MKNSILFIAITVLLLACQKKEISKKEIRDADFDKARSLVNKNNDSAFFYFSKVATSNKDSLKVALSYNYMASIQAESSDYFGSLESLALSLKFLNTNKKEDYDCLSSTYNELGVNNYNLKNYQQALTYFENALKFSEDDFFRLIILNNKALVYQKAGKYNLALNIYEQLLLKKSKNTSEYARVLSNIAKTQWLQNPRYDAAPKLLMALKIRKNEKDEWGLNASYSHLSDYYSIKSPDSALGYAIQMYKIAQKLSSPDDQLEALQKLIKLSPSTSTKQYFQTYQNLNDSIQTVRSAAKNQFAVIRYASEKNKADFLKAQAENIEKQKDILLRNIGIATLFIFLILGYIFYQRRQKSLRQEKEIEVKKTELKYVKKVHDGVANGLYLIMNKLDNQESLKNNPIINEIEELYEQSRDISYERPRLKKLPFNEKIADILKSFASDDTKVIIVGNSTQLWEKVTEQAKDEIEHILQELMVNMDKHSQASDVLIKFEQAAQKINIYYTDNGIGISGQVQPNNGLTNTGTRIATIGGSITFDTNVEKGLKIQISFPVS
ncbi:tetratricopeptide repeat-containing sensor histidine kinase [Pedobacter miscanthi]|uniref:ATP-binding protein n=1 Tax=Pedobacter miscanthi TaxID=2259170 RepID=A0A366KW05_9SPHI|nr:tetratricopeptide repeat-containing sensor histidine kinase [Pedobacter miscanthi]RBQ05816.1 ATP-binding protein [Pedobacter miscanthi]